MTGRGLRILTCTEPETAGDETVVAAIVIVLGFGIAAGGVYTPVAEIVPTVLLPPATEFTLQVTAAFVLLATVAVKVVGFPSRTWLAPETLTLAGWLFWGAAPPPELQPDNMVTRSSAEQPNAKEGSDRDAIKGVYLREGFDWL